MGEPVLVTGGAGYIGSHTCKALAQAGFTPVTYDNLSRGHGWAVKWGPLEKGDLADKERLRDVIAAYRPLAAIHFAAFIGVGESVAAPDIYYRNNVVGSLCLLEVMRDMDLKKLVFSSTAAVYGRPQRIPIGEDHPLAPVSPYGTSKFIVERMLSDFSLCCGLRSVVLRYFNAAGADPDGDIGEAHVPESHLIPLVLDVAAGHSPHITILGNDYDTPDGTCIRDYLHVVDLAQAHVLALRRLLSDGASATYNLGNGCGHSVFEVVVVARRMTGRPIPEQIGPRRAGDPPALVADSARAMRELGWKPRHIALEEIIRDAWKWTVAGASV